MCEYNSKNCNQCSYESNSTYSPEENTYSQLDFNEIYNKKRKKPQH